MHDRYQNDKIFLNINECIAGQNFGGAPPAPPPLSPALKGLGSLIIKKYMIFFIRLSRLVTVYNNINKNLPSSCFLFILLQTVTKRLS